MKPIDMVPAPKVQREVYHEKFIEKELGTLFV